MDIKEYLALRIRNGKITVLDEDPDTKKKNADPDSAFIRQYGKDMTEFWEKATTQKALLWALRGLGMDSDANMLWSCIAKAEGIILHHTRMTEEQSLRAANFIRDVFVNPFTITLQPTEPESRG
jgi:hypothetical protein